MLLHTAYTVLGMFGSNRRACTLHPHGFFLPLQGVSSAAGSVKSVTRSCRTRKTLLCGRKGHPAEGESGDASDRARRFGRFLRMCLLNLCAV